MSISSDKSLFKKKFGSSVKPPPPCLHVMHSSFIQKDFIYTNSGQHKLFMIHKNTFNLNKMNSYLLAYSNQRCPIQSICSMHDELALHFPS